MTDLQFWLKAVISEIRSKPRNESGTSLLLLVATLTGVRSVWEEDVESSTKTSQVCHIQQHGHGKPGTADGCASKPCPGRAVRAAPLAQHPSTARDAAAPKQWEVLEELAPASDSGSVETSRGISRCLRSSGCTRGLMPVMDAAISCASRNHHPRYLLTCFIIQRNCPISRDHAARPAGPDRTSRGRGRTAAGGPRLTWGGGGGHASPCCVFKALLLLFLSIPPSLLCRCRS